MNIIDRIHQMLNEKYNVSTAVLIEFTASGKLMIDATLPVEAWIEIGKLLEEKE